MTQEGAMAATPGRPGEAAQAQDSRLTAVLAVAADRLGEPQTQHWRSINRWNALSIAAVVLSVGVVALTATAAYYPDARGPAVTLALGALVLVTVAYGRYRAVASRVTGVVTFAEGLVIVDGSRPMVVPWTDVLTVWPHVTEYALTLECRGLDPVHLNDQFQDIEALSERVESEVRRRQLPDALRRVRQGETVRFGPVAVGPHGINNGRETLPWRRLLDITVAAGRVMVLEDGRWLAWSNHKVVDVPNLVVFLALARALAEDESWPDRA
jgi:hypothetical protein